jgi:hypothetical protein
MTMFGFGQRVGQVMQMAYVVEDIRASIDWWIKDAQTGPWFLLDHFWAADQVYRGAPSRAECQHRDGVCGDHVHRIDPAA